MYIKARLSFFLAFAASTYSAAQLKPIVHELPNSHELELTVVNVGTSPLPFQALRVRLGLKNTSKNKLGPLWALDESFGAMIKTPGSESFRAAHDYHQRHSIFVGSGTTPRQRTNSYTELELRPNDETLVSFAFGADWGDDRKTSRPLFDQPGEYQVKCYSSVVQTPWLEKVIKVQVQEPKGADRVVHDMLAADNALACALMSPQLIPAKDLIDKLTQIVEKHGKSSYADYARFALARAYFGGNEVNKGISLLQATALSPFAYQPNVLIALRIRLRDENESKKIADWLNREHFDAIEWLEVVPSAVRERVRERSRDLRALINSEPPPPDDVRKVLSRQLFDNESEENITRLCAEEWRAFRIRPAPKK